MNNKNKKQRNFWFKLKISFLNSEKVDFLMSQTNGSNYVVIYQILCLKALNSNGELASTFNSSDIEQDNLGVKIQWNDEKIQRDCKWFPLDTIRVAKELFMKLGLLYRNENNILQIADYQDLIGSETASAKEKRQLRQKQYLENRGDRQKDRQKNRQCLSQENDLSLQDKKDGGDRQCPGQCLSREIITQESIDNRDKDIEIDYKENIKKDSKIYLSIKDKENILNLLDSFDFFKNSKYKAKDQDTLLHVIDFGNIDVEKLLTKIKQILLSMEGGSFNKPINYLFKSISKDVKDLSCSIENKDPAALPKQNKEEYTEEEFKKVIEEMDKLRNEAQKKYNPKQDHQESTAEGDSQDKPF